MNKVVPSEYARDLLEAIEQDPDVTQASLARRLGVAVGTPEGIALRARLTVTYIDNSMQLYRKVRDQARKSLQRVKDAGFDRISIHGNGDIADICRLTCIEMELQVVDGASDGFPMMMIEGSDIHLENLD
jgi:hypothetical protein